MSKYLIKTVGLGGSLSERCEEYEIKERIEEIKQRIPPGNKILGIYKEVTNEFL